MPKLTIAHVIWNTQDAIYQVQEKVAPQTSIPVMDFASAAWQEWLGRVPSFAFQSKEGHRFTARKEARARRGTYWVAYRKAGGKLTHSYIGRPEAVTLARLEQVARSLAGQDRQDTVAPGLNEGDAVHEQQVWPASSHTLDWQDQYLATKFFVPTTPHALVRRPRLFSLLEEGRKRPLTLVSAPAGFGKTTLLAAWVQAQTPGNQLVAWVSLDEEDNDPVRFWSYVLTALDRIQPGTYRELARYLRAAEHPPLPSVLTACLNRLAEGDSSLMLVLDDYHLITEPEVHTSLSSFLEHLPAHVHVLLSTRADPPLPLTRLRGRGHLLEVRADQLRTTPGEATAFLREVMHVDLPEHELAAVEKRTEGWLVGLQLVGLSLQGRPSSTSSRDLLEEISGQHGYILDYLTEEVLSHQEPAVQHFLLHTCILERLTAPLCDAVTGQRDSQQMLEALQRTNLFVVPLDSQRRWYRYHALFAEALRARLEQEEEMSVRELHQRASQWFAGQGDLTGAVQHALSACDWQRAADLIEQHRQIYEWTSDTYPLMHGWLQRLPEEVVRARPRLCLFTAHALSNGATPQVIDGWLIQAEAAMAASRERSSHEVNTPAAPAEQDDLLGMILAWRALLAPHFGDAQAALVLSEQALLLLSEQNLDARQTVTEARLHALTALGEVVTHDYVQRSAYEHSRGRLWTAIGYLNEAAIRAINQTGRLHEAWGLLKQAVELGHAARTWPYPEMGDVSAFQALVLREWNQLEEAHDCAHQAVQIAEHIGSPMQQLEAYGTLLRIAFSRGELEEARAALEQAERAARDVTPYNQAFFLTVERVRFLLASREPGRAERLVEHLLNLQPPLVPLARERVVVALARVWLAQGRPEEVLSLLIPLLETASRQERWANVIELRLLIALAYQMQSDEQQALIQLSEAVRLAQPEGYIRSFVDEGAAMGKLLSALRARSRRQNTPEGEVTTRYLERVLAAFAPQTGADHRASQHGLPEPLSGREHDVLTLMAVGASNQEIAERLVISVDTVKRHVSNVLSKLGVSNRTQAVSRARELGLLAPERQHSFDGHIPLG